MDGAQAHIRQLSEAIGDERVLTAMAALPREQFVSPQQATRAYENVALPIDCGQTISQPVVVGRMLELLELGPEDRVLDVGTGSGYHAALLAQLAGHVWTIERHAELADSAQRRLAALKIENVTHIIGDGAEGLPEQAPFQAINVAAATGPDLPGELVAQLADGGRLVAPLGSDDQHLVCARRAGRRIAYKRLEPVRFVPLVRDPPRPAPPDQGAAG